MEIIKGAGSVLRPTTVWSRVGYFLQYKSGKIVKVSWVVNFSPTGLSKAMAIAREKAGKSCPTFKCQWIMTYLAWGRQGLFQTFFKVVLHKRHCCWPTTYFLPFLSLLMNIISWKIEATQTWGRRNMLRLLKTASGS